METKTNFLCRQYQYWPNTFPCSLSFGMTLAESNFSFYCLLEQTLKCTKTEPCLSSVVVCTAVSVSALARLSVLWYCRANDDNLLALESKLYCAENYNCIDDLNKRRYSFYHCVQTASSTYIEALKSNLYIVSIINAMISSEAKKLCIEP